MKNILWKTILCNALALMVVSVIISCSKHTDIPGLTGPKGATGETGEDGKDGQDGQDGKDGEDGSGIRKGFHVIGFGDPNDTSAPNTGTVILNNEVLWDTVTTKPTSFIVYIPGTKHPDDLIQVSGTGSKTSISYHFEVK